MIGTSANSRNNPQRRSRDDFLDSIGMTGPISNGSGSRLRKELSSPWWKVCHCKRCLMRRSRWINQYNLVKQLNSGRVHLRSIGLRLCKIDAAKRSFQTTRPSGKLCCAYSLELQFARNHPRIPERSAVGKRIRVEPDDTSPISWIDHATGSKRCRTAMKIALSFEHEINLTNFVCLVEKNAK